MKLGGNNNQNPWGDYIVIIHIIASIICALLPFVLNQPESLLPAALVSIAIAVNGIAMWKERRTVRDEMRALRDKLAHEFDNDVRVTSFKDGVEARAYLEEIIKDAKEVYNTHINTSTSVSNYLVSTAPMIRSVYQRMLRRANVTWTDAVSGNLQFYKQRFTAHLLDKMSARFTCIHIGYAAAYVNFIVVKYHDQHRADEVMFGWGLHQEQTNAPVFSSRDARVVEYFSKLFEALVRDQRIVGKTELLDVGDRD